MTKLYRGDVIEVIAHAGYDEFGKKIVKRRPVILLNPVNKASDIISVYCTTQNDGEDTSIFVPVGSKHSKEMGFIKDTYIRPDKIINLPKDAFVRLMGKCPIMDQISAIIEKNKSAK